LVEILEDALLFGIADSRPGIPHLRPQPRATPAAPDECAGVFGVPDRVGDQIAQDALDKKRIRMHVVISAAKAQR